MYAMGISATSGRQTARAPTTSSGQAVKAFAAVGAGAKRGRSTAGTEAGATEQERMPPSQWHRDRLRVALHRHGSQEIVNELCCSRVLEWRRDGLGYNSPGDTPQRGAEI